MSKHNNIRAGIEKLLANKNLIDSEAIQVLISFLNECENVDNNVSYILYKLSKLTYVHSNKFYYKRISETINANNDNESVWQLDDNFYRFTYNNDSVDDYAHQYGKLDVINLKNNLITETY